MTMAISEALRARAARRCICASTGNTSASRGGLRGARRASPAPCSSRRARSRWASWPRRSCTAPSSCRSTATSTTASTLARKLAEDYPRRAGQLASTRSASRARRPRRSRSSTRSATPPTSTACPVGNAGNITAYWKGYSEYAPRRHRDRLPRMLGLPGRRCGAARARRAGAATRRPSPPRSGSATRRRGTPRSRPATSPAGGSTRSPTTRSSPRTACWPRSEGVFVEPASAASVAGLLKAVRGRAGSTRARRSSARSPATGSRTPTPRCRAYADRSAGARRCRRAVVAAAGAGR